MGNYNIFINTILHVQKPSLLAHEILAGIFIRVIITQICYIIITQFINTLKIKWLCSKEEHCVKCDNKKDFRKSGHIFS